MSLASLRETAEILAFTVRTLLASRRNVTHGTLSYESRIETIMAAAFRVAAEGTPEAAPERIASIVEEPVAAALELAYLHGYSTSMLTPRLLASGELRDLRRTTTRSRVNTARQRAAIWARQHAGELIVDIKKTTRKKIADIIARLLGDGEPLTSKQARDMIAKAIGDRARAQLIARTEVMRAVHEGQRAEWRDSVSEGLIKASAVRRRWITADDEVTCPVCDKLDRKKATLNGTYPGGFEGPPAHPNCRCTEELVSTVGRR